MIRLLSFIIRIYQKISHTLLPRSCRFYPSCSQYALESLQTKGLCLGIIKITVRLLKCSPFSRGGYDPVTKE